MDHYYEWLQRIRERPGLFLGVKSLDSMFFHHLGYLDRTYGENSEYRDCLNGTEFEEYVHTYYDNDISSRDWHSLIVLKTESQEAAFDKFFELFDAFISSRQEPVSEVVVKRSENTLFNYSDYHSILRYIRDGHNMYLFFGEKSLDSVFYHHLGYSDRAGYVDPAYTDCFLDYESNGFREFVYKHYDTARNQTAHNGYSMIVDKTNSQEEAFDKFFELYDEFMASKQQ